MALNVGVGLSLSSGKPLTALAANPVYGSAGEIPEGPRGSGFETVDGFKTRTPVAVHTRRARRLPVEPARARSSIVLARRRVQPVQPQRALDYDPNTQTSFPVLNPDFGQPSRFNLAQLETPRQLRIGVRYEF